MTLLEPRAVPGAGVAYSTAEPSHHINVPASRMQLAGEEEGALTAGTVVNLLLPTIRRRGVKMARCTPARPVRALRQSAFCRGGTGERRATGSPERTGADL